MNFEIGKWYSTSDGFRVEFIKPIEQDGMYNVFRHGKDQDYKPFYTDKNGVTAYGESILEEDCLSCEFEPDWGETFPWIDSEKGGCKFPIDKVCAGFNVSRKIIIDKNPIKNCPAWRPK